MIGIIALGLLVLGCIGFGLAIFQDHLEQQTRKQKIELSKGKFRL